MYGSLQISIDPICHSTALYLPLHHYTDLYSPLQPSTFLYASLQPHYGSFMAPFQGKEGHRGLLSSIESKVFCRLP